MAVNNIDVRQQNKINVYEMVLFQDKIPRQKIAEKLELSLPTVAYNLKQLIEAGLAVEDGVLFSTGGRKASTVSCVPNARIAIGIDITQNHIGFAAVNLKGDVIDSIRLSQKFTDTPDYENSVLTLFNSYTANLKIPRNTIIGVGISVPGIVNKEGTELVESHRLGIYQKKTFEFIKKINYPTILFNDATAAGMAEISKSPEIQNAVFLSLSNSIGGAIIIDRKSVDGEHAHSAEFGHICSVPGGKQCYCGKTGHFDSYCSALALSDLADGSLETFFKKLELKDISCIRAFSEYIENLSTMICNLHIIFDTTVILGGYVGSFLSPFIEEIKQKVIERDTFKDNPDYIKLCQYKNEASAVGAALHFINQFIQTI
ncbi:MAG: ROK family transcriptional regulator [Treponema sp.]|nr:ROK family transcriptional regulator [Treponema sp.]